MTIDIKKIRNFAIIAHIDHGKSTLADRIIEFCGGVTEREKEDRILDSMDLEKEKGITIKAQTVRLKYRAQDGNEYILNLMDTPGHVDFAYEVNRCLAACEGSLLLVDATQGVEAQTLANAYHAIDNNHDIIPVLNKIDLPSADVEKTKNQIEEIIGIDTQQAVEISAKTGFGVENVLESIVKGIRPPEGDINSRPKALLIDSWYDSYLGVIVLIRIINGSFKKGDKIKMMSNNSIYQIDTIGVFTPKKTTIDALNAGEIGFITGQIKQVADCNIGDTIILANDNETKILTGFKSNRPVVFCGFYPIDASDYDLFKESLAKLHLNDASFEFVPETSSALGFGFRCGFLGLLHMEIIQERLEREFNLSLITTAPSVIYRVYTNKSNEQYLEVHNPSDMPEQQNIVKIEEPWVTATIMTPDEYLGNILKLCTDKRGIQKELSYIGDRVMVVYSLPLNEIVYDFYDRLKSLSSGYASFDWELSDYRQGDLIKLNIFINGETVDALSMIIHRSKADSFGRNMCLKLKDLIPKQMIKIAIQAAINNRIIARETINAYRKDVLAKCYGGDITRKRKLLEKQKRGKKKMQNIGNVEIPQGVFLQALKLE